MLLMCVVTVNLPQVETLESRPRRHRAGKQQHLSSCTCTTQRSACVTAAWRIHCQDASPKDDRMTGWQECRSSAGMQLQRIPALQRCWCALIPTGGERLFTLHAAFSHRFHNIAGPDGVKSSGLNCFQSVRISRTSWGERGGPNGEGWVTR